jgi:hypothetical protein
MSEIAPVQVSISQVLRPFWVVSAAGFPVAPGAPVEITYSDEDGNVNFNSYPFFTIPAYLIADVQISGGVITSGGGYAGGGFGIVGTLVGIAAASAANAATRRTDIRTYMRVISATGEITLLTNAYTPQQLQNLMAPIYVGIRKWTAIAEAALSDERECPYCAERIKRAAIVCRFCGRNVGPEDAGLLTEPASATPTQWRCFSCSNLNLGQAEYCGYCGRSNDENVDESFGD